MSAYANILATFLAGAGMREHGNFAGITALAMVPIMTGVAGVVDFVSLNNKSGKLQNSLDILALAIATKYYSGMSGDELTRSWR
ncbi:pilus assembly protein TadG-related protein (plasmid) [Aminobacter sp. UC22_36]|uniref:pilus assembly protein TadG-related protein n=1 Tax=Aminobacter sp. UC22_36 TaxID=3374549 RepID=UPI003756E465